MNKITNYNPIDEKVFADEIDFKTLEHILSCLNHITPKKVSREEFENLNGDYLKATGEDKDGVYYDLFLPEDMMKGEYLSIIHFLDKKFDLNKFNIGDDIITSTKMMIKLILKQDKNADLEGLAKKYGVRQDLKQELQPQNKGGKKINFSQARRLIKQIKEKRKESEIIDEEKILKLKENIGENPDDLENYSLDFTKELELETLLTFFRKGKNMLRYGMMTMTQAKQRAIIKYCEENGYEKQVVGSPGIMTYFKGKDRITINTLIQNLDRKEKLLREKIGVDELAKKLAKAREAGDEKLIEESELSATKTILGHIWEYGYINTSKAYGFQLNKIVKYKELYCSGLSCLVHSFLAELGINHNGLNIDDHIALELITGNKRYYLDPASLNELYEFEYGKINGSKREIKIIGLDFPIQYGYSNDVEKSLLSSMLINKSNLVKNKGLKIKILHKAMSLDPENHSIYINLGNVYSDLTDYDSAVKYYNKSLQKFYNWKAIINIGNQSYFKGDIKVALSYYKKALPDIPFSVLGIVYETMSELYRLDKEDKKMTLYKYASDLLKGVDLDLEGDYFDEKKVISTFPENVRAHFYIESVG